MNKFLWMSIVLGLLGRVSFAEESKPVEFGKEAKHALALPESWKATVPETGMRQLEVVVPKQGDDKEDAEITVFMFPSGGGFAGNLARWKKQFGGEESLKVKRKLKTASGVDADIAELEGTYKGMSRDGATLDAKDNYKMLGAVIVTEGGEFYIKLTGPKATVDASKAAFDKAIESFK